MKTAALFALVVLFGCSENCATWRPAPDGGPEYYLIKRDGEVVTKIYPCGPGFFCDGRHQFESMEAAKAISQSYIFCQEKSESEASR